MRTSMCRRGITRWIGHVAVGVLLCAGGAGAAPTLSADAHVLAVHADGTVRAWGADDNGKLGIGRSLTLAQPHAIGASPPGGFVSISVHEYHAVALTASGEVWAWGGNSRGQLGDGTLVSRTLPVRVPGLPRMVQAEAGFTHTVALDADGVIWAWGGNDTGALGDGTTSPRLPKRVAGIPRVSRVWAGFERSYASAEDGAFYAWGDAGTGQLGDGMAGAIRHVLAPKLIPALRNVVSASDGGIHTVVATADGAVWTFGLNQFGGLGNGVANGATVATPIRVNGLDRVTRVSAGWSHTLALGEDGTLHSWGDNRNGELGTGTRVNRYVPGPVAELTGVTAMAAGSFHSLARRSDGSVWAWGANYACELGGCEDTARILPARVAGVAASTSVAANFLTSFALNANGALQSWGLNAYGQLGNNEAVSRTAPVPVAGLAGIVAVAAGPWHSLAVRSDGTVLAWGATDRAQAGASGVQPITSPTATAGIAELRGITAVAAGAFHSVALRNDGRVFTWGVNLRGALGDATPTGRIAAREVPGVDGVVAIAAGALYTLALRSDGTVLAWGDNLHGQLGDGLGNFRANAAPIPGLADVVAISAKGDSSLALKRDGSVWAWGPNNAGQSGDGTNNATPVPRRVAGLPPAAAIAAGAGMSAAVTAQGTLWVWGNNYFGVQGDGAQGLGLPIALPHEVAGVADVAFVAAGLTSIHVLKRDGTVIAWGGNIDGALGDGTLVNRPRPVVTVREGGAGSIEGGDWFLRLATTGATIALRDIPSFGLLARQTSAGVDATLRPRAQDSGNTSNVYVFALAPADMVRPATDAAPAIPISKARGKDGEVACVLAQLNASGQLVAVTAAQLQAYVTGVLNAQGQAVTIVNGVPMANIGGATFFVGYGNSGTTMLAGGVNRSVVTIPGQRTCAPQAPKTGWWYNPAEPGRGYSIEVRGNQLFFAAFHYDASGRPTWNFAGGATSMDGSLFVSDFLGASGGQSLTGAYRVPNLSNAGAFTLAFSDAAHGTMIWPGGTVAIERQPFVPNGLTAPAQAGLPEAGWWWNPQESGRGFFIEWQDGVVDIAGYMYDDVGNPTWYIAAYATPNPMLIEGNWWTFGGGQSMGGAFRPATRTSDNAGALRVEFASSTTATMTLPDGRRVPLVRQAF